MNPAPFLVSFPDKHAFKAALSPEVVAENWADTERLIDGGYPPAVSVRVVSCLFGFSAGFVGALSRRPERYYRTFQIRKGKKQRQIHAPRVGLKVVQKWLGHHLSKVLSFEDCVHGFVAGRSAPMAAVAHCGAAWVYSLDISDFFPTTSGQRIAAALEGIGYPTGAASLVSALCCYEGNLAQGSPASPVLSNLVFGPSDERLKQIALETGSRFTRYADDVVFSGTGEIPLGLEARVRSVITDAGWAVAKEKEHLAKLPRRLKVHGLLVQGPEPRLTKGYRNRIRAFSHLTKAEKVRAGDVARLKGHVAYAKSIKRVVAK